MSPEEILIELARTRKDVPVEALRAAGEHRAVLTPQLLGCLAEVIAKPSLLEDDPDLQLPFYAMYLLAAWRERLAQPLLLAFLRLPGELSLDLSGDIVTEDMDRMLAQTAGDDVRGVLALVADPAVNEFSRKAALRSLQWLNVWNEMPRETLVGHLRAVVKSVPPSDPVLSEVFDLAVVLRLTEMRDELFVLYDEGQIDAWMMGTREEIAAAFAEPLQASFWDPIEDVAEEVGWWQCFTNEDKGPLPHVPEAWLKSVQTAPDPPVNVTPPVPFRAPPKPGRNDPCPCGSGKKYKKCCGA